MWEQQMKESNMESSIRSQIAFPEIVPKKLLQKNDWSWDPFHITPAAAWKFIDQIWLSMGAAVWVQGSGYI